MRGRLPRPAQLPPSWREALHGLHRSDLPSVTPLADDLCQLVTQGPGHLCLARGWEALCAREAGESLRDTALRWRVTQERVRQLQARAIRQLRVTAAFETWATKLYDLALTPCAVEIAEGHEPSWAVLVRAARNVGRLDLHTLPIGGGAWALFRLQGAEDLRYRKLPAGRYYTDAEAAEQLEVPSAVLAVAWPGMRVQRTVDGWYVGSQEEWNTAEWAVATARVLAASGYDVWEERHLFAAIRALPGAPDVQDKTMQGALRKAVQFTRTPVAGVWRWHSEHRSAQPLIALDVKLHAASYD